MIDQDRREPVAEGELQRAAEAPATNAAAEAEAAEPETAVQPTPELSAAETSAAVVLTQAQDEPVAEAIEAQAEPVAEAIAESAAGDGPDAADGEGEGEGEGETPPDSEEGASFTPTADGPTKPRRVKDLDVGMELDGRVTSIAVYGIFVDIGVGRDGLVHISEMSDTRIESPSEVVQINDTVRVRVKSVDPDARRISLTMRTPRERPPVGERGEGRGRNRQRRPEVNRDVLGSLKVGDIVEGVITGMSPFGAFADIGVGKDGLIHISELSEGRVEKPEDAVKVGDRYTFKLLEVDPDGNRISLSLRKAQRSQRMQQLEPGQQLDGTVSGIAPFGAFVDIGVGRDGLVHISALSDRRVNKVEDVVKVGDKVTVKVLEVDPQSKRISLTMRLEDPKPVPTEETPPVAVVPRTGPGAVARFAAVTAAREEGRRDDGQGRRDEGRRDGRREGGRGRSRNQTAQPVLETYTTESEPDAEFEGNATLDDLLNKFGGPAGRRDRDRRREVDEEEDDEARFNRRQREQRDAIRRTLQQVVRDE